MDRLLKSRSGRAFLDACETLTKERTGTVTQEKLAEAIKLGKFLPREQGRAGFGAAEDCYPVQRALLGEHPSPRLRCAMR